MEVMVPISPPSPEFNFDSTCSSPYAPSSPKRFGDLYFSAPSSPSRVHAFYRDFNNFSFVNRSSSSIPYDWEETPGTPKSKNAHNVKEKDDFEFGFSGQLDKVSAADELFVGGKIKPLTPPPRLQLQLSTEVISSPRSPRSPMAQGKKMFKEVFSPKKTKEVDPFAIAIEKEQRGRERVMSVAPSSSRKQSRSLSPFRYPEQQSSTKKSSSSRKWSFRDLLLFRSASEGRASERDPLRKFSLQSSKRRSEDVKNSSFRSTDSSGSMRRGRVSAHELHYKSNRAVSEEMKRKTFLPYKHGLFGWFRV